MKKLLIGLLILCMTVSVLSVGVSAELPDGVSFTPGVYAGGDAEQFSPVGDVEIRWEPELSKMLDLTDGDLNDWYAAELGGTVITPHNMISWVQTGNAGMEYWKMTALYAADSEYLYVALDIADADFTYGDDSGIYSGDSIQLTIDFGKMIREMFETDPDQLLNPKGIFYSFSCIEDGQPLRITRQESDNDMNLSEENGDGVKGAARRTHDGWSVELALSWQMLYEDYSGKTWDDSRIYVSDTLDMPLQIGLTIYYLNRAETNGEITWAAGTTREWLDGEGNPCVSWTVLDEGITLTLPWQKGMKLNCKGVVPITGYETTAPDTEADTDINIEVDIDIGIEMDTLPPVVTEPPITWEETLRDAAEEDTLAEEIIAILEKYGCTAVVEMGSLIALCAMAAAVLAIRKKK